jgi:rubrerythrin
MESTPKAVRSHYRQAVCRPWTSPRELIPAKTLKEILAVNLKEEAKAINLYQSILKMVDREDVILYEVIEDIIEDEQEHREELSRLQE